MRAVVASLCALLLLVGAACVAPARSFSAYEGKAADSADAAASAVQTARLAAHIAEVRRGFAPYLSIGLAESEKDAGGVRGTFDSIQPPDARSDDLRDALDPLLLRAVSTLSQMRIAARRGDFARVVELARSLDALARQLSTFAAAHR